MGRAMTDEALARGPRSEATRLLVSIGVGAVSGIVAGFLAPAQLAALVGWDVTAAVLVIWVWSDVGRLTADQARQWATREDSSRAMTRLLLLAASVASLVGVLLAFVKAKHSNGALVPILNCSGLATVVCSWLLVHSLFALRYARLYYEEPVGGIDFKSDHDRPDYQDFAYVAFTVGMTFQVSDTDIAARVIRRTILRQALLSYLFGTVIVASTINVLAGLLK